MTQKERSKLFKDICTKYENSMWIHPGDCGENNSPYSIVLFREIVLPRTAFSRPSAWNIMCLLHEIGHVKTNAEDMPVYQKEYLATQWSAEEAKKIGFKIEDIWKECFQNYIWDFLKDDGASANREELVVNW